MRISGWMTGAVAGLLGLSALLAGCKVETSRETTPRADGDGGGTTTYRVAPMDRDEVKEAASEAIDETAEAAQKVRDAAISVGQDAEVAAEAIRARREAERREVAPTPAPAPVPVQDGEAAPALPPQAEPDQPPGESM